MVVCGGGSESRQVFKVQPTILADGLDRECRWREDGEEI